MGVANADMDVLAQISVRAPLKLAGVHYADLFAWLSSSLGNLSRSRTNQPVTLQPPGWAQV